MPSSSNNITTNTLSNILNNLTTSFNSLSPVQPHSSNRLSPSQPPSIFFSNDTIEKGEYLTEGRSLKDMLPGWNQKINETISTSASKAVRIKKAIESQQDNIYNTSSIYNQTTTLSDSYPVAQLPPLPQKTQLPPSKFSSENLLNIPLANVHSSTLITALTTLAKHSKCEANINVEGDFVVMALGRNQLKHPLLNSNDTPLLIVKQNNTDINLAEAMPKLRNQFKEVNYRGAVYIDEGEIIKTDTANFDSRCIKIMTPEEFTTVKYAESVINKAQQAISQVDFRERIMDQEYAARRGEGGGLLPYSIAEDQKKEFIISVDRPTALALQQKEEENITDSRIVLLKYWTGGVVAGAVGAAVAGIMGITFFVSYIKNKLSNTNDDISYSSVEDAPPELFPPSSLLSTLVEEQQQAHPPQEQAVSVAGDQEEQAA